jgi:hypothetical protein
MSSGQKNIVYNSFDYLPLVLRRDTARSGGSPRTLAQRNTRTWKWRNDGLYACGKLISIWVFNLTCNAVPLKQGNQTQSTGRMSPSTMETTAVETSTLPTSRALRTFLRPMETTPVETSTLPTSGMPRTFSRSALAFSLAMPQSRVGIECPASSESRVVLLLTTAGASSTTQTHSLGACARAVINLGPDSLLLALFPLLSKVGLALGVEVADHGQVERFAPVVQLLPRASEDERGELDTRQTIVPVFSSFPAFFAVLLCPHFQLLRSVRKPASAVAPAGSIFSAAEVRPYCPAQTPCLL